jgi:aspartyl-tRNA(Asn)/glutamyl-tRNA(Gln) amidotransferase subunit B
MYERGETLETTKITAPKLAALVRLIEQGTISGKIAKDVFADMLTTGKDAEAIVREKNLVQVTDEGFIVEAAKKVLEANAKSVEDYRGGKANALKHLMGQLMRETRGKANPVIADRILKDLMDNPRP